MLLVLKEEGDLWLMGLGVGRRKGWRGVVVMVGRLGRRCAG